MLHVEGNGWSDATLTATMHNRAAGRTLTPTPCSTGCRPKASTRTDVAPTSRDYVWVAHSTRALFATETAMMPPAITHLQLVLSSTAPSRDGTWHRHRDREATSRLRCGLLVLLSRPAPAQKLKSVQAAHAYMHDLYELSVIWTLYFYTSYESTPVVYATYQEIRSPASMDADFPCTYPLCVPSVNQKKDIRTLALPLWRFTLSQQVMTCRGTTLYTRSCEGSAVVGDLSVHPPSASMGSSVRFL